MILLKIVFDNELTNWPTLLILVLVSECIFSLLVIALQLCCRVVATSARLPYCI